MLDGLRGEDCIAKKSFTNSRTILRDDLEARIPAGLGDRLTSPELAAHAMRAHAEETKRLNRERRGWKHAR